MNDAEHLARMHERHSRSLVAYCEWLHQLSSPECVRWSDRLKSNHRDVAESAIAEAVAWDFLKCQLPDVNLSDLAFQGGPDFSCKDAVGRQFFVEVTNLTSSVIANKTNLHDESVGARHYSPPARFLREEIDIKSKQFRHLNATCPILVFITCLGFDVSRSLIDKRHAETLLTSESKITSAVDLATGEMNGPLLNTVDFKRTLFTATKSFDAKRRHISGALLGGFGLPASSSNVIGVLHPDALHPFSPSSLPDTCFGMLDPWPPVDEAVVVWKRGNGERCDESWEQAKEAEARARRLKQAGPSEFIESIKRRINEF